MLLVLSLYVISYYISRVFLCCSLFVHFLVSLLSL